MPKPAAPRITDFETSFEAIPVPSADGDIIWADVRIDYILSGLAPSVTIRVPVPWSEQDSQEERKSKALRCARQLIDHACRAAGVPNAEPDPDQDAVADALDAATPTIVEGIVQELGLTSPTSQPRRRKQ